MLSKNILVLTVLMISGINESIQRRITRDADDSQLDVTIMTGKWYLVASSNATDNDICLTNTVEADSITSFTMHLMSDLKPDMNCDGVNLSEKVYNITMSCRLSFIAMIGHVEKKISNGVTKLNITSEFFISTILDGLNNIYIALYAEGETADVINGSNKLLYLFGREKTMTEESLGIVKTYSFPLLVEPLQTLRILNSTECS